MNAATTRKGTTMKTNVTVTLSDLLSREIDIVIGVCLQVKAYAAKRIDDMPVDAKFYKLAYAQADAIHTQCATQSQFGMVITIPSEFAHVVGVSATHNKRTAEIIDAMVKAR